MAGFAPEKIPRGSASAGRYDRSWPSPAGSWPTLGDRAALALGTRVAGCHRLSVAGPPAAMAASVATLSRVSVGTLTREARGPARPRGAWIQALGFEGAAVIALTLAAAALRFTLSSQQGFWFDEANTAQLVGFTPGEMLTLIKHYESTPPLYYCVAWVWARIFGYGEAGLRSLSALAGVLAVPVAFGAAAKLVSKRAGVIAAALDRVFTRCCSGTPKRRARTSSWCCSAAYRCSCFAFALERPSGRAAGLVGGGIAAGALHRVLRGAGGRPRGALAAVRAPRAVVRCGAPGSRWR